MKLGHFLAVIRFLQVDGEMSGHTRHGSVPTMHDHALTAQHGAVHPANALEIEEALVVDVAHHQPEFIRVSAQENFRSAVGIERGIDVAVGITADLVGVSRGIFRPDALPLGFKSRGRGGFKQLFEKFVGFFAHGTIFLGKSPACKVRFSGEGRTWTFYAPFFGSGTSGVSHQNSA